MSDIISDLRRKEQRIQEIRNQESRRQGQEDTLRAQLKSEFNLNTIEEANDQLSSINQEIAATEKNLQVLNAELESIIQSAVAPSAGASNG
jgi:uncharacterized coiled-coil protein SlyX